MCIAGYHVKMRHEGTPNTYSGGRLAWARDSLANAAAHLAGGDGSGEATLSRGRRSPGTSADAGSGPDYRRGIQTSGETQPQSWINGYREKLVDCGVGINRAYPLIRMGSSQAIARASIIISSPATARRFASGPFRASGRKPVRGLVGTRSHRLRPAASPHPGRSQRCLCNRRRSAQCHPPPR